MNLDRLSKPQRLAAGCMLVVAIGAFLPWVSIFGIGVAGIEGDGQLTLLLALVGLVVLAMSTEVFGTPKLGQKPARIVLGIAAILTALIGLGDMNGAAAIGLYLTLFGGLGWIAALVWEYTLRMKAAEGLSEEPTT
ncbi:MAG: hypothetical protein JJD92_09465 [Frankiaceae bacterium]|nr:hypothetical protein [Frankiaceae bacterium]